MTKTNGNFFSQKVGFLLFGDGEDVELRPMTPVELESFENELIRRASALVAEVDRNEAGDDKK